MMTVFTWLLAKFAETAFGGVIMEGLEHYFPDLFKGKTKELVDVYEKRIREKNKKIRELEKAKTKEQQRHDEEESRLIDSLKRRSIATDKLIEQYHKPLNAILISYATQREDVGGRNKESHFLKEELEKYNSKYLGGTDVLIPPAHVPSGIKSQGDLKKWFEEDILKGRYCKIKFMILFDIKKSAFWGTYLPYIQKKPMHHSVGEVLSVGDVFTEEQINKLALSEIIKSGDIAWLASSVISEAEIEIILRNQKKIEQEIGNPSLRVVADGDIKVKLSSALSKFIQSADSVADAIIDEAKFWNEKIKG